MTKTASILCVKGVLFEREWLEQLIETEYRNLSCSVSYGNLPFDGTLKQSSSGHFV